MVLWKLDAPETGDARGVRWEWGSGGVGEHSLRGKGKGWSGEFLEGRPGRGTIFRV